MPLRNDKDIMPVRRVGVKERGVTGRFFSFKLNRIVECESLLEMNFCYLLEFDKDVVEYEEQPETFILNGFRYTPDFRVVYANGATEFVEVKPFCKVPEYREKFRLIENHLREKGFRFRVWTEEDFNPVYLDNLKFLYRYIQQPSGYEMYAERVLSIIREAGKARIEDIIAVFPEKEIAEILPVIWHMIARNIIRADLNKPLNASCEVSCMEAQRWE